MRVFTRLIRSDLVRTVIGSILAAHLRFVGRTTRFFVEPADPCAAIGP